MILQKDFHFPLHLNGENELNELIDEGDLLIYFDGTEWVYVFSEWPFDEQAETLLLGGYPNIYEMAQAIFEDIKIEPDEDPRCSGQGNSLSNGGYF